MALTVIHKVANRLRRAPNLRPFRSIGTLVAVTASACLVAACGGTKVVREPQPIELKQPLASVADAAASVRLDWVIVRDGPGSWARDADWDEYLMTVSNQTDGTIRVTNVEVVDQLGIPVTRGSGREELIAGSRVTVRRYADEGLEIRAGVGAETLLLSAGVAGAVAAHALAQATVLTLSGPAIATGGAATLAAVSVVAGPVLLITGASRAAAAARVGEEIERRQTRLPLVLPAGEQMTLDLFFPLTPSPAEVHVTYENAAGERRLSMDTRAALDGLHLRERSE